MAKKRSKRELQNDLLFYLEHYNEITSRSKKKIWDDEIKELIKELKN
ncbi:MAG: hypothetical protein QM642_09140 [Edaphocola sp.]